MIGAGGGILTASEMPVACRALLRVGVPSIQPVSRLRPSWLHLVLEILIKRHQIGQGWNVFDFRQIDLPDDPASRQDNDLVGGVEYLLDFGAEHHD